MDPLDHHREGENLVSRLSDGNEALLTLDPELQAKLEAELARFQVPYGSVVAMAPSTGRVLAYVSHSSANPEAGDLARDPRPPAASVFKVITAAALLDAGISPDTRVCYGGGLSKLTARDLLDDPNRDRWCATFAQSMGGSINAVFAKLATRHLTPSTLARYASAFGFDHSLPFDVSTWPSTSSIPDDPLEFARTAAGFWHTRLSPLHAAVIAATIANDGEMPRPSLVQTLKGPDGAVLYEHEPSIFRPVIPRQTARTLAAMMERTVTEGTAKKAFFDDAGHPFLPGIRVAGKTGTLTAASPYRGYTWWVGFAPVDAPRVAVAALVVNSPRWRIKASYLARQALRFALL